MRVDDSMGTSEHYIVDGLAYQQMMIPSGQEHGHTKTRSAMYVASGGLVILFRTDSP